MTDRLDSTLMTDEERARKGVRGYSREFSSKHAKSYRLAYIPAQLWISARAKAKRDGVSMRTLILRLLHDYVHGTTATITTTTEE